MVSKGKLKFLPAAASLCESALFSNVTADRILDRNVRKDESHIFLDDEPITIEVIPVYRHDKSQ